MIIALFIYNEEERHMKLKITGHAEGDPKGQNLVCAAVSALALTAANAVMHLWKKDILKSMPMVDLTPGNTVISVTATPNTEAEMLMVFWTLQSGIDALEKLYPEKVTLGHVLMV